MQKLRMEPPHNQTRGRGKYLKNVATSDCKTVARKVRKMSKKGKKVVVFFQGQRISPRVLRGDRFFLSHLEEAALNAREQSPQTPPGFQLISHSRASSPMSLNNEDGSQSINELPHLPSVAVAVQTQTQVRCRVQVDSLPWFKFRQLFATFLVALGIDFDDGVTRRDVSCGQQTGYANHRNDPVVMDSLRLWLSNSQGGEATCLIDLCAQQHDMVIRNFNEPGFLQIADAVFSNWTSNLHPRHTEEDIYALQDYFRPFILEGQDGELLEGAARIAAAHDGGLLQFLSYTINLLSNNLLKGEDVDRFVQWIDHIQGNSLLAGLLSSKMPTLEAFASNLLPGALRLKNAPLVESLLQAGVKPNSPTGYSKLRPLELAAQLGSKDLVQVLLKHDADVNAPPTHDYGNTALQAAAGSGSIEIVQLLLDAGANVNAASADIGRTALQAAAARGNIEIVQLLLIAGADVEASPAEFGGRTALQDAAESGSIEIVQLLLDAGANVNAAPDETTALQAAAEGGNIEIVQLLLKAGADVNAPPAANMGRTALQAAAEWGMEIVQLLLDAGADVNAPPAESSGRTALQAAAARGNIETVQLLLNAGADVEASPAEFGGRTALQDAAEWGDMEIVQLLLYAGADVNAPPAEFRGRTALQAAAERGNIEIVRLLLYAGADVNAPPADYEGHTALQAAAEKGNMEIVQLLLYAGADVNAPPAASMGRTALQAAVLGENMEIVRLLLNARADVNAPPAASCGRTALQAAAERGNIELVQLLLDEDAHVNALPSYRFGVTALQAAAIRGNIAVARLLIEVGADVNAPAAIEGRTALEGASEHGRIDILQLLVNAGADMCHSHRTTAQQMAAEYGHDAVCELLRRC